MTTAPSPTTTQTPTTSITTTTVTLDRATYDAGGTGVGITIDGGGDVDFESVTAGESAQPAVRSGNGSVLIAGDGNTTPDSYLQFRVTDDLIYEANPTSRIRIEVEYLDQGTDAFIIEYDAVDGGPHGNGTFKNAGLIVKTGTGTFRTAELSLCDAYFANRDNGADFRIADGGDGAETIRRISVILTAPASSTATIHVDDYGADPFDDQPDSEAIQAGIDQACPGDTVLFTSGANDQPYVGYLIDRTLFLVRKASTRDLTFTSTDPSDHALLTATVDLAGFVVRLYARSGIGDPGSIDDITIESIDIDGNRNERKCYGPDNVGNGIDDNWGSWLPECDIFDDPWCSPGTLAMDGAEDPSDPDQDFEHNSDRWSTGLAVRDMILSNNECGTVVGFIGAAGVIDSVTIDTAGDHVHGPGCAATDPDEAPGGWSDGITLVGPAHRISNNVIRDASDIGIVTFGGRDTVISGNTVIATPGNHGMFAGIAVGPYAYGNLSGLQVIDNQIINEADTSCGGIHAGFDIGVHMWRAGCEQQPAASSYGTVGPCSSLSPPPGQTLCIPGQPCRVWGYVPSGSSFTLADNTVTGAHVNFLIGGLEIDGDLVVHGNVSNAPRLTDWQGAAGCTWDGITDTWGPLDFVARDPTVEGWLDRRIYCER